MGVGTPADERSPSALGRLALSGLPFHSGALDSATCSAVGCAFDEACDACLARDDVADSTDVMRPQPQPMWLGRSGRRWRWDAPDGFRGAASRSKAGHSRDRKQSFSHRPGRWPAHGDAFEHGVAGRNQYPVKVAIAETSVTISTSSKDNRAKAKHIETSSQVSQVP